MMHSLVCPKCQSSKLALSRVRHVHEALLYWIFRPWRCLTCGHRELKFRLINMNNPDDRVPPGSHDTKKNKKIL